jgi:hypothetical protein
MQNNMLKEISGAEKRIMQDTEEKEDYNHDPYSTH